MKFLDPQIVFTNWMDPPGFLERTLDDQLDLLAQISRIPPKFQFPPIRIPEFDAAATFFCNFLIFCDIPVLSLSVIAFLRSLRRSYPHFFTESTIPLFLDTLRHCFSTETPAVCDAVLQMIGEIAHDSSFGAKFLLEFAGRAFDRAVSDEGSDLETPPAALAWSRDPEAPLLDGAFLRIGPLCIDLSRSALETANPGLFAFQALCSRCLGERRLPFCDFFGRLWEYVTTRTVYFNVLMSALLVIRDLGRAAPASFLEAVSQTQLELIVVQFLDLEVDLSPIQIPVFDIVALVCCRGIPDSLVGRIPVNLIARCCRSGWLQSSAIPCMSAILSNAPDVFSVINRDCPGWLAVLLNRVRVSAASQLESIGKIFAVCIPQCSENFGFDVLEFIRFSIELFEREDPPSSFWFLVAIDRLLEKLTMLGMHEDLFCPTFEYCSGRTAIANLCSLADATSDLTDLATAFFTHLDGIAVN
jgi:hypothetical protein